MLSSSLSTTLYSFVSSANSFAVEFLATDGKSLMKMLNKTGPRTLPCGMPLVTSHVSDVFSFTTTRWLRPVRYVSIHLMRHPPMPLALIFDSRRWCGTLSNALRKSKYRQSIPWPSSRILVHCSRTTVNWVEQDLPLRNPYWSSVKRLLSSMIRLLNMARAEIWPSCLSAA